MKKFIFIFILLFSFITNAAAPVIWYSSDYGQFLTARGYLFNDLKSVSTVTSDPSAGLGFVAPRGSLALYDSGATGTLFVKSGTADTAWTDLLSSLTGWSLTGNAIDDSTDFLGSTNTEDLIFKTDNVERLRISSTGSYDTTLGLGILHSDASGILTSSAVDLASGDVTGILTVDKGGSGLDGSAAANGSLLIGNGTGYSLSTLTGTANQVNISNGSGSITLSTPQDIAATSSPTFASLTLSSPLTIANGGTGQTSFAAGLIISNGSALSSGQADLTTNVTGILPLANGGTNKNMIAVNGGVVWTDADSMEVISAGTAGQLLTSNGAAAPTWTNAPDESLQAAYEASTQPQIVLNAVDLGIQIDDAATPIGSSLFAVRNNAGTTSYLNVDVNGISTTNFVGSGTLGAVRVHNLTTAQKNALTPGAGMVIYDTDLGRMQCYVSGSWGDCNTEYQNSDLTLTASDTIAISLTSSRQTWLVQGNAGPVVMSTTPFGSSAPVNGAEITFIGNSDTNTVEFVVNDAAKGIIGYGATISRGQTITYKYNSTLDRYVIKSTSN